MTSNVSIGTGKNKVSARLETPAVDPVALILLAHGAGARRDHPSMDRVAGALLSEGFAVLRFNFPYTEKGRKAPDRANVLVQTWLEVHEWARSQKEAGILPLLAGGRSMGGRMASLAAAQFPDEFIPRGLIFFAYPLHPPGNTEKLRADHLGEIKMPMLFLSGTRDSLARVDILETQVKKLGRRAHLHLLDTADHGFHVLKRSGKTDDDIIKEAALVAREWTIRVLVS